jgi:hypothetical protein
MKALYFNDLRNLPNFGCRSTGAALEDLLISNGLVVDRVEGLDSVNNSGWDSYAKDPIRIGGPKMARSIYTEAWRRRRINPKIYKVVSKLDSFAGAKHDYITPSPGSSVELFLDLARQDNYHRHLLNRLEDADIVAINGEGTLIFSNNTRRDALYLLFVIELGHALGKPVFLFNAMITSCPYEPPSAKQLADFSLTLSKCRHITLRENFSYAYTQSLVPCSQVGLTPDALFTWHSRYKWYRDNIKNWADSSFFYQSDKDVRDATKNTYVTLSASSSIWRYRQMGLEAYLSLASSLLKRDIKLVLVETCAGDGILRSVSDQLGVPLVSKESPLDKLAGIISGSSLYISGRYHPGIASYCADIPCIFMGSNSHKTLRIQEVVGIDHPHEYTACPDLEEIDAITRDVLDILSGDQKTAHNRKPKPGAILDIVESIQGYYSSLLERCKS